MDWPGLLKWSLQYSDGTASKPALSEEDMSFLRGSIQQFLATVEDPNKIVKDACEVIKNISGVDSSATLASLELILKCIDEDPEVSRNLPKLNVTDTLLMVLSSQVAQEVLRTLQIFATALQNNPGLQSDLHSKGCLPKIFAHLTPEVSSTYLPVAEQLVPIEAAVVAEESECQQAAGEPKEDETVSTHLALMGPPTMNAPLCEQQVPEQQRRGNMEQQNQLAIVKASPIGIKCRTQEEAANLQIAAMGAVSAFVRHNRTIEKEFLSLGGLERISAAFVSTTPDIHKLQTKAANLLKCLLNENVATPHQVDASSVVEGIAEMFKRRDVDVTGMQYGEVVAELLIELLQQMRFPLAKLGSLRHIETPLNDRITWLKSHPVTEEFDPSHEMKLLDDAHKLLRVALMSAPKRPPRQHR